MSNEMIGVLCIVIMFALMAMRMWVGTAFALTGFIGVLLLRGFNQAWTVLFAASFNNIANYSFTVMPMFILMGCIISETNIGSNLFKAVHVWIGRLRGGLAYATVLATGLLGAITGSQLTGAIVMSKVALPEMEKYKYKDTLSCGSIAASSPLGILIPPSNALVLFGILTEISIGKLFIAGVLPGVLTILVFFGAIIIWTRFDKNLAPVSETEKPNFKEKVVSLKHVAPIIVLFVLCLVSIYTGICTATEAGALGAFGSIIIAFVIRELTFKKLLHCLKESAILLGMIMLSIMGTYIFSSALTMSGLPAMLSRVVSGLGMPNFVIMFAIIILYLILGCFLPEFPMLMMTVPILYPIVKALGFDLLWFGVMVVVVMSVGMLTPPVGMTVYTLAGITKKPVGVIFKGVVPFIIAEAIVIVLLMVFPAIATWLPGRI